MPDTTTNNAGQQVNGCNIIINPHEDPKETVNNKCHIDYYLHRVQAAIFLLDSMQNDKEITEAVSGANVQQYNALMTGLDELASEACKVSKFKPGDFLGQYNVTLYDII